MTNQLRVSMLIAVFALPSLLRAEPQPPEPYPGPLNFTHGNRGEVQLTAPPGFVVTVEAESGTLGGDFITSGVDPVYITIGTNSAGNTPGSSARVARYSVTFPQAGTYQLFARIYVGPDGFNDDSMFAGSSFGPKNPTVSGDWVLFNGLAGIGFTAPADVVYPSNGGTAGYPVWKWVVLDNRVYTVSSGTLTQTFDIGGREDGLAIDKLFFGMSDRLYTVADLDAGGPGTEIIYDPVFTVNLSDLRQEIDGFGASSAWVAQNISDAWADLFFTTNGIGLSLLRLRITPTGTTWETVTAQKAVARGAKVWATPWSPQGAWKDNGLDTDGGVLLPEYWDDWANLLSNFVVNMNNAGVPLVALSAQNEPDFTATWESCRWTPAELTAFIRDYLGPALAANGLPTRVLAAEPVGFTGLAAYANAILGDATASSYVTHIANHSYAGAPFVYTAPADNGKRHWQTEYTEDGGPDPDPTIDSGLRMGNDIHDFLTISEGNAWHYWWLLSAGGNSTGGLVENNVLVKRGWVLGNWSRYVRPGYRRVALTGSVAVVRGTAFVSPDQTRLVIVIVNSDNDDYTVPVTIQGGSFEALSPFETSAARSLEALSAVTAPGTDTFQLFVPARSVTTFVGDNDLEPPTPNPATFSTPPTAISSTRITMTATTGSDASGPVEYYFTNTAGGGNDSGWQASATYTDSGLTPNTQYTYTVTMRDSALVPNTGAASAPVSATTFASVGEYQESGGIVSMEAEHGEVGSRWIFGVAAGASNGEYIEVNPLYDWTNMTTPEGTTPEYLSTYNFNISTAGNYSFWFRMYSTGGNDDSFFWRIDNGGWILENNRSGVGAWFSTNNAQVDGIGAGSHVLEIAYRENGSRLDKFVIQLDSLPAPTGNGPPESIPTSPNQPPSFAADPISKPDAIEGIIYSSSIAGDASDPEDDPISFSKLSGPAWLTVASDGTLSGTPGAGDLGMNVFTVYVEALGGSDTATLNIITVINEGVGNPSSAKKWWIY